MAQQPVLTNVVADEPERYDVEIDHPHGRVRVPLPDWLKTGPGPRGLLTPCAVIDKVTGERIPVEKLPLGWRNTTVSRTLAKLGLVQFPWKTGGS